MIFRRIKAHVQKEDWFAVFIDFIIVVFGVFMGLQVANWSDERKENALTSDYLQRLHGDMTASITATSNTQKFISDITSNVNLALDSLETCELAEENRDAFANGLFFASVHIQATFADGTLKELQSAGRLGLLKNTQIRDLLIEIDREVEYQARTWPSIIMRGLNQTSYMDQIIIFRQNQQRSGFALSGWGELDVDFDELCEDRKFRAALAVHERFGYLNLDWLDRNIENFRELKTALEAELGLVKNKTETTP